MSEERRTRLLVRLTPWLIIFGLGFGSGFWVRDRQQQKVLQDAIENAREEMEDAGIEALERARRVGQDLSASAEAAAESTKAAFRRLIRGNESR